MRYMAIFCRIPPTTARRGSSFRVVGFIAHRLAAAAAAGEVTSTVSSLTSAGG